MALVPKFTTALVEFPIVGSPSCSYDGTRNLPNDHFYFSLQRSP